MEYTLVTEVELESIIHASLGGKSATSQTQLTGHLPSVFPDVSEPRGETLNVRAILQGLSQKDQLKGPDLFYIPTQAWHKFLHDLDCSCAICLALGPSGNLLSFS